MDTVEDDDEARNLASLASQVLGIRRPQAERLAERYVRELPGSDWERFLRWISDGSPR
jgi:hypothetical protein